MHYTLPQSIYRNKNLSWPKITINILKTNYNYINKYIINHGEKRKKPFFLNM